MGGLSIHEELRRLAHTAGLDDGGAAPVALPEHAEEYQSWIDAGHHAEMAWLARNQEVRFDLRERFPWAKSVLVGLFRYGPRTHSTPPRGLSRHISDYAQGDDYHDLVLPRLQAFVAAAHAHYAPGVDLRSHSYVDTGPALERQLAEAAGLGWRGKNSLLLNPRIGSWFFLGVAPTELSLSPTGPIRQGSCGQCEACQPACPTGAFVAPGVLDARRCISYLTIEHKGPVARELRPALGEWIFGCDLCQSSCPFNHGADEELPASRGPMLLEASTLGDLDLPDLLSMDEEEFRARFRSTPLWRPRRRGLLRNALMVAANLRRADCRSAALHLLRDEEPTLREGASWYFARCNDRAAIASIQRAREEESESWVRTAMAEDLWVLGEIIAT